jgi:outer membrane assembly lipoprotein YfiO
MIALATLFIAPSCLQSHAMKSPRRIATYLAASFAFCLSANLMAGATAGSDRTVPKTEELRSGRWIVVDQPASQPAADPTLQRVEDLIARGRYSDASDVAVEWFKSHKGSPLFDRALFLNAEALYRYGDRVKAFFYLDELMDEYPDSRLYYPALEKQFVIAEDFLPAANHRPYKSRFLWMPILGREEEAINMLYRIQQRSPGSPLAERALLRTADYYYLDRQYDLAGDAYAAYAHSYPRSPLLAQVKLRQAYSNLAQFRGPKFDATPAIDARAQMGEMIALYPDVAKQENLETRVRWIDTNFAKKLLLTGAFYRRTHEPTAAVYTYRSLINAYPNSPEARQAQAELNTMPAWALKTPAPAGGAIGIPTSQPSASAQ